MGPFLQRRIVDPLKLLLRQGITPQKVALSLACGVVCRLFPVPGTTTLLCAAVALLFRLNLPAVQLVNYFIYPAQLALILPFIRAGKFILRPDRTKLSLPQMIALLARNHVQALHVLWRLALHGIVAWLVLHGGFCNSVPHSSSHDGAIGENPASQAPPSIVTE